MNVAVEVIVLHAPQLVGIWLVLLVMAGAALTGLAAPRGVRHPRQVRAWLLQVMRQPRREAKRRAAEAAESARFAEEMTVAAQRAATTAARQRAGWHDAAQQVDVALAAYQTAETALLRAQRAAAFATPDTVRTPAQYVERERFLHRAATAACRRGELSLEQLDDALAHRNGWSPRLHPVEQELVLARAAVAHLRAGYRLAAAAERTAWHDADLAAAAVRTLRNEADRARVAQSATTRSRSVRPAPGHAPVATH